MKRYFTFILICSFMITPLIASVTAPSPQGRAGGEPKSASYSTLWKAEQQQEEEGKPKSAYKTVQTILQKALREGQEGQALSARLRAIGLHQQWAPDSFFTDIAELEALRQDETRPVACAIYASILAEAYESNRHRSQANGLVLTIEDIKEWTVEQYDSAATANWQHSLANIPALADARSKDWLPFVTECTNSSYFKHDLLHVLWQRLRDRRIQTWDTSKQDVLTIGQAVKAEYARRGNREAELLIALDLTNFTERTPSGVKMWKRVQPNTSDDAQFTPNPELIALIDQFGDLPLCSEVYLRLIASKAPDSMKVAWAHEAQRRYPRYERINEVQNCLNALLYPEISWSGNSIYYPGMPYIWHLDTKNVTSLMVEVMRLPDDFSEEAMSRSKQSAVQYLRNIGKLVQKVFHPVKRGKPYETTSDSLEWKAPDVGHYVLLFTVTTDEPQASQKQRSDYFRFFHVSRLLPIQRSWDKNIFEVVVVDAESGQPVPGATVQLYEHNYRTDKRTPTGIQTTNAEGRARFTQAHSPNSRLYTLVSKDEDRWLPEQERWNMGQDWEQEREQTEIRLYTDRAIYRPGQIVHLGGVVFSQKHWDIHTIAQKSFEFMMRDANGKEVGRQSVSTDEMGVFSADFILPEGGLPGIYSITTARSSVTFRVEEYKRPTFEVKMDEAPTLQWPQDSIRLTGKAVGYNGVPIREARVTGTFQFTYPYWWWFRHEDSPQLPVDTVSTDETGSFCVPVPLKDIPAEAIQYGLNLRLDVQVLSATGETREGCIHVPLCTTPLRMNISMDDQQDRDRLKMPNFALLTSTGKETAGTIRWHIVPKNAPKDATPLVSGTFEQKVPASDTVMPNLMESLKGLPSGEYELRATTQVGADTASASATFMLFGMDDKQLARHTDWWFYMPTDKFDAQHPARIQVGSSFDDVALYYTLASKDGIVKDELIHLSNELQVFEIPYLEAYGDGVSVNFVFVKHGVCHADTRTLRLIVPDSQLRWEWTSFRDHLHPGDKETWTLRLKHPDGTPAEANLMATIFDASLNQLTPHDWHLYISRHHNIPYLSWQLFYAFIPNGTSLHFTLPMKHNKVEPLSFDQFDARWLEGIGFIDSRLMGRIAGLGTNGKGIRMMKARQANDAMVEEEMAMAPAPMPAMATADMTTRSEGATLIKPDMMTKESATVSSPVATLRTNFNETAAFMPRLHSNPATGEVTLAFTLPESLTTWQLLGVAHTTDMQTANIEAQAIASKELMVRLHMPRFLRIGDAGNIRAVVQNLTDEALDGTTLFEVFDPETERLIIKRESPFQTSAKGEAVLSFDYTPTEQYPIVAVRFTATTSSPNSKTTKRNKHKETSVSTSFSDGEQYYLAILPAKEWVTESIEIQADSIGTFTTDLSTIFNKDNSSATQRRLTVEYTTHPIWNVVQALPALLEPETDDVLSLASAFYANTLAAHIAATTPRLQTIIELWKEQGVSDLPLTSPLTRDEELKQVILDETPWLREAENDSERRAQLINLFNTSLVESRIGNTLHKLSERQQGDGGFSWFPGMRSSELMTRLVAIELTHLRVLTNQFATLSDPNRQDANRILQQAFSFVAKENARRVQEMKKAEAKGATINTGDLMHLHYVYITQQARVRLTASQQADVRYLLDHLKGSVAGMSNDERAMAAIVLKADKREREARLYYDSMVEHLTTTTHHGTYFDYASGSFTPTGHKVIMHTAALEAVRKLAPTNRQLISGMRRWLLQQKRTQMWESSICTTNAIYALLNGGDAELKNTNKDELTLNYGRKKVMVESDTKVAAMGYVHAVYTDGNAPKSVTVQRNSPTEAWGAVYAQYLTPVAEASAQANRLSVRRELSTNMPRLGDRLTTRYVITADRDYEYVCLRAQRPASAEPGVQVSGYRYQGGLGYYLAVRDAHTDYFFDRLPKGTYVLEETSFIDRTGTYTTGLCRIQCLYAPEFEGHSNATSIEIRE